MIKKSIYTVGGTVQAGGGLYIQRRADEELLKLCLEGAFAYVLTSRQLGKSSLMVRTAEQLAIEGTRSVIVDLTQLGVKVTAEAWYLGLLTTISDDLMLDVNIVNWWRAHADFGITQRLTQFFQEVVLPEVTESVVIFIDEIDSTISLDFTDDFFATIRYLYNVRARVPAFQRLTFVLIGVATPGELITDPHRTPFNIGQQVNLTDFTFEEASPLADGLGLADNEADQVLHWVLKWTGGHPYLTQRLCRTIAEQFRSDWSEAEVDRTVATIFFGRMSEEDNNLQFVRDMLTKRAPDKVRVLSTYRDVRLGRRPVRDEEQSHIKSHLKLSGVVKRENGKLRVRNPIYHQVFDRDWIKDHWPVSWFKTIPISIKIAAAVIFVLLLTSLIALAKYAQSQQELATKEADLAQEQKKRTEEAEENAKEQKRLREAEAKQRKQAEAAQARAENLAKAEAKARADSELAQARAVREKIVADSLAREEKRMRELADTTSVENERLRIIEIARYLAVRAPLQKQSIDKERDVLLAQQAYLFNKENKGTITQELYEALQQTLNNFNDSGGPKILRGHQFGVRAVAFHPNGKLIASASDDATVRIWDVTNPDEATSIFINHEFAVRSVVFSPDGQFLISAGDDKIICVRKFNETSTEPKFLLGHTDWIEMIAIGPQGRTLASAGGDKILRLWDVQNSSTEPTTTIQFSSRIWAIAFNPDGQILATAGDDKQISMWTLPKPGAQPEARFVQEDRVFAVAFSPDGKWLASGSYEGKIRLWNPRQPNSEAKTLLAHAGRVNALAFSPDSRLLASGSSDMMVKLWDLQSGRSEPILEFQHPRWVWDVVFSPDGKSLITGCEDRAVRIWVTSTDLLAEKVCGIVKRNLTEMEWNEFVGSDIPYEATCPNLPPDNSTETTASIDSR